MQAERMTEAPPPPPAPTGRTSLGWLALCALLGTALFAGCGDDGNLLGSDGAAGEGTAGSNNSAGSGNAGNASGGSNAHAGSGGAVTSGGQGGSTAHGGQGGSGGATCQTGECIRANVCLDHCGGTVVYSGCCACPAATVEELSCAAGGGGQGGGTSHDCVGQACGATQTCVAYRVVGGAAIPPDQNGQCDVGQHVEGNVCQDDFDYTCAELTGCSAPSTTCHCAAGTACARTPTCRVPGAAAWLDASAELICELQAP